MPDIFDTLDTQQSDIFDQIDSGAGGFSPRQIAPEWMQNAATAAKEQITGLVPHSLHEAAQWIPGVAGAEDAYKSYKILQDVANGSTMEEATQKYRPEDFAFREAEKTPAGSLERFRAGFGTALPLAIAGGGLRAALAPKPAVAPQVGPETVAAAAEAENVAASVGEPVAQVPPAVSESVARPAPVPQSAEQVQPKQNLPQSEIVTAPAENASVKLGEQNAIPENRPQPIPESVGAQVQPSTGETVLRSRGPLSGAETGQSSPEVVQGPPAEPTSTQNAVTAQERLSRGFPEATQAARRDFGTVWDEAAQIEQNDSGAAQRLVATVAESPRALSDLENAQLLRRQIEVQNEHDAAIKAVNDAPGDPAAMQRLEAARNDTFAVYEAGKAAGTEQGRGLNARRMLANNDFTLAKMEAETRAVANEGRPLSAQQAADVKALHERIRIADEKIAAYENKGELRKAAASRKPFSPVAFLDEQAALARERISARQGRLYSDPLGVTSVAHLADEAIIGAAHIARGLRNFGEWSAAMVKDFGEGIKPYLKGLFAKAQSVHSDAARLAAAKSRTITSTVQTLRKIGASDFEPRKPSPVKPDKHLMELRGNLERAKAEYHRRLESQRLANQTVAQQIGRYTAEVLNTSRALKTSFDVSAVLRQGGVLGASHPLLAAKNLKPMFEALASEKKQYAIMEEIKARTNFPEYKQSKLELTEVGGPLSHQEEVFRSRIAEQIPGVAMSERAYVTFLDRLRADSYDAMKASLSKRGTLTPAEGRIIANYINVASGRGPLGRFQGAANALNLGFFAPRWAISRFQYLLGQPMLRELGQGSFRVRKLLAQEYARSLTGIGLALGLGAWAGATISKDPDSPDLGKLKFGNTRVDMFSGLAQAAVFMSREYHAAKRAFTGSQEKVPEYLRGGQVAMRFARGKLAPIPGATIDVLEGKNVVGQPVTPASAGLGLITPLAYSDIQQAMVDQGVEKGTALGLLSLFGAGLQTYESKSKARPQVVTPESIMRKHTKRKFQMAYP